MSSVITVEREIGGRTLRIETGRIARQASAAVYVTYGESAVLVAVAEQPLRSGWDFFPLLVDYRERGAAMGLIWGGRFMKREGRPTEKEILTMRMIDRPVRPLFPDGYMRDVLIGCTVWSADPEVDPDIAAMIGASAALSISPLPWQGPTGSVRVGMIDGKCVLNPTYAQRDEGDLDLVISAKKDALTMVEAAARQLSEEQMIAAIETGHEACRTICEAIEEMVEQVKPEKYEAEAPAETGLQSALNKAPGEPISVEDYMVQQYIDRTCEAALTPTKFGRRDALRKLRAEIVEEIKADDALWSQLTADGRTAEAGEKEIKTAFEDLKSVAMRKLILDNKRCDGRTHDEVRPIDSEVGVLPRTHGSALFTRGETQAMVCTTLGTTGDEQLVESLAGEYGIRFLLHYNFPSYCVGEVKPPRGPGRREIGHGILARRAILPVLPDFEAFPYTMRIISDITESNGSSSMATVCGTTLALMDAGVPIKDPVAGIAMGLVQEGDEIKILSDILGDEDHYGDMDFKVAGTQRGITALQMDIKMSGLSSEILKQAMSQAKEGRIHILKKMMETINKPRPEIPEHAPKIVQIKIDPDKIGKVIGPGGKTIRGIQDETGAKIDIDDDGTVVISAVNRDSADRAMAKVEALTVTPQIGKIYEGEVRSVRDFGAFVEILPGVDGMVHVSELDTSFVKNINDFVKPGDQMRVKLTAIDDLGRIRLSRKALLLDEAEAAKKE